MMMAMWRGTVLGLEDIGAALNFGISQREANTGNDEARISNDERIPND
jgi:hypothetical protein